MKQIKNVLQSQGITRIILLKLREWLSKFQDFGRASSNILWTGLHLSPLPVCSWELEAHITKLSEKILAGFKLLSGCHNIRLYFSCTVYLKIQQKDVEF